MGEDAAFLVDNTAQQWTQGELDVLDAAVGDMHEVNGTDTTIQKGGGGCVTFVRHREHPEGSRGRNDNGTITIYDAATVGDAIPETIVVHELGRNWDTENPYWHTLLSLSGWTRVRPLVSGWTQTTRYSETWWYHASAVSYDDQCQDPPHASTHPMEDWATCIQAYLYDRQWMQENMPGKYALVDNFLRNYEGG